MKRAIEVASGLAHEVQGRADLNIAHLGQVFTPPEIVRRMMTLMKNRGRVLEPACGNGAFLSELIPHCRDVVGIEQDSQHCPPEALNIDFFTYSCREKFDTIMGNPPYVKARDIVPTTRNMLASQWLDGHANLYLHFIEKCLRHLNPEGELIFITPRDFLKSTGAHRLNAWLYQLGSITHFTDLGDAKFFAQATPNCAIWRFQMGARDHRLDDGRRMVLSAGQISFVQDQFTVPLRNIFSVKVGAVSGADNIFAHAEYGNVDFVCSKTAQNGQLRRMIFDLALPYLEPYKRKLLARRVRKFDERNWWQWGRRHHISSAPRIYVNQKTRQLRPFFLHSCIHYDGAVLALFPHNKKADVQQLMTMLNTVDWSQLGFVCGGRFLFAQRSLENALLPDEFSPWQQSNLV